jgi:hypothetical protein
MVTLSRLPLRDFQTFLPCTCDDRSDEHTHIQKGCFVQHCSMSWITHYLNSGPHVEREDTGHLENGAVLKYSRKPVQPSFEERPWWDHLFGYDVFTIHNGFYEHILCEVVAVNSQATSLSVAFRGEAKLVAVGEAAIEAAVHREPSYSSGAQQRSRLFYGTISPGQQAKIDTSGCPIFIKFTRVLQEDRITAVGSSQERYLTNNYRGFIIMEKHFIIDESFKPVRVGSLFRATNG